MRQTEELTSYHFLNKRYSLSVPTVRLVGWLASINLFMIVSCAGPKPAEEYTLARTAMQAARAVGAPSFAPGYWAQAEESYRKGEKAYADNANYDAKDLFESARIFAEKAENSTRIKKFQSGEGFP